MIEVEVPMGATFSDHAHILRKDHQKIWWDMPNILRPIRPVFGWPKRQENPEVQRRIQAWKRLQITLVKCIEMLHDEVAPKLQQNQQNQQVLMCHVMRSIANSIDLFVLAVKIGLKVMPWRACRSTFCRTWATLATRSFQRSQQLGQFGRCQTNLQLEATRTGWWFGCHQFYVNDFGGITHYKLVGGLEHQCYFPRNIGNV